MLPYDQYLKRFPAYLQQLTMESNGKHVTLDGSRVDYDDRRRSTGASPAPTASTRFYQLIHQGTRLIPCDFIGFCRSLNPLGDHHDLLMANVFAQTEALAFGKTAEEVRPRARPTGWCRTACSRATGRRTRSCAERADAARRSGKLVALYEHSVFTQGVIWGIDSFDQWGVELGKVLAKRIIPELESDAEPKLDARQLDQRPDPPLPQTYAGTFRALEDLRDPCSSE